MDKTNNKNRQDRVILAQLLKVSTLEISDQQTILLSPLFNPALLTEKRKGGNTTATFKKASGATEGNTDPGAQRMERREKEQN